MPSMKTASISVRIQQDVKKKAEDILEKIGLSRSMAIDMYYRQIIINNGIPFSLTIPKTPQSRDNMSDAEFNSMMDLGYRQAIDKNSFEVDEVFDELEREL